MFVHFVFFLREHWFTVRRLGTQWFNLNSLLEGPELVSNTYLGEFLAQLQHEGYDIFLVTGDVSSCFSETRIQPVTSVTYCSCPRVTRTWCCRLCPPRSSCRRGCCPM